MPPTTYTWPNKCSAAMIANAYGITKQAVSAWPKKQDAPINPDGSFNLAHIIAWREEKIRHDAYTNAYTDITNEEDPTNTKDPALRRKREAEAALKEIQVAEKCHLLIRKEEAEITLRRAIIQFRQTLEGLPTTLARDLEGLTALDIAERLRTQIHQLLHNLQKNTTLN